MYYQASMSPDANNPEEPKFQLLDRLDAAFGHGLEFAGVEPDDAAGPAGIERERRFADLELPHVAQAEGAGAVAEGGGRVDAAQELCGEAVTGDPAHLRDGYGPAGAGVAGIIHALALAHGPQGRLAGGANGHDWKG